MTKLQRRPLATWWDVPLQVACPSCGAEPGERCRTARGRAAESPHVARVWAAG